MNVRFPPRYARGFALRDEHALGLLSMFPPRYARGFALRDERALGLPVQSPPPRSPLALLGGRGGGAGLPRRFAPPPPRRVA